MAIQYIKISGCINETSKFNGIYELQNTKINRKPFYRKIEDNCIIRVYSGSDNSWIVIQCKNYENSHLSGSRASTKNEVLSCVCDGVNINQNSNDHPSYHPPIGKWTCENAAVSIDNIKNTKIYENIILEECGYAHFKPAK